jgi:hypothetical protein
VSTTGCAGFETGIPSDDGAAVDAMSAAAVAAVTTAASRSQRGRTMLRNALFIPSPPPGAFTTSP